MQDILSIVGRVLLGGLFVVGGIRHFFIVPMLTDIMIRRGVPAAKLVLIAGSTFQIVAGALLMAGWFVPLAALGLILFTVAASIMMMNFWDMQGEQREMFKNMWMANLAIIGGLLLAAAQAMK